MIGARAGFAAAAIAVVAGLGIVGPAGAVDPAPLLPDLETRITGGLSTSRSGTQKLLRLSNEIVNAAPGVLELTGVEDGDCDADGNASNDRRSFQRIYVDTDGNGVFGRGTDQVGTETEAGCTVFHPEHNHFHFEALARYEVRTLAGAPAGGPSQKVSFCIADTHRRLPGVPGSPTTKYYGSCSANAVQGISAGWADRYPSSVPGQHVDITGVADGDYCLISTADPENRLQETDETDNATRLRIRLRGWRARVAGSC